MTVMPKNIDIPFRSIVEYGIHRTKADGEHRVIFPAKRGGKEGLSPQDIEAIREYCQSQGCEISTSRYPHTIIFLLPA